MSLAAYRHLLRSMRLAFHGDQAVLTSAHQQARGEFMRNASMSPEDPELAGKLAHAEEVAKILKENIVQGKLQEDNKYKLRIHEHTERGDNDTIKMPNGKKVVIDGKKCSEK